MGPVILLAMIVAVLLPVGAVLLAVGLSIWTVRASDGSRTAEAWATTHGLTLTPATTGLVRWYLRTGRQLRTIGVLAGIGLPALAIWSLGIPGSASPPLLLCVFVGYLAGALYAEIVLVRRGDPTRRRATLVRRRLDDYLHPGVLLTQRLLAILGALAVAPLAVVPVSDLAPTLDRWAAVVVAVGVAGFGGLLEVIERWLVSRPQPFDAPDLVAVDDAIRASSLHAVGCAGIAVMLMGLGTTCLWLAGSDVQLLRWTMWVPGVFAWPIALYTFLPIARRPRQVTRPPVPA